ncbi:MAG: cryptochrome/photolyase family protein, partial [Nitrospira sp.]
MRGLIWFRRDLRLADQPALSAACAECDEVIPLFVFDDPLLRSREFGAACVNFMLGSLRELAASLEARGLALQWRRGDPIEEVVRAAHDWNADVVYWNRDYEPRAIRRDQLVQQELERRGIIVKTFKDQVVFESQDIRGATGEPLQRYSAYRARWWTQWSLHKPRALPVPAALSSAKQAMRPPSRPLPSAEELGYASLVPWIEPGEQQARKQLRRFCEGPLHCYSTGRNIPSIEGTSKLSPHFRFGTISPRTAILAALHTLEKGRPGVSRPDVFLWIDELIWREFFQQILAEFPHVVSGPFRQTVALPVRERDQERDRLFQAWCEGKTGYPIVDAGMRQLRQTGWMHNRVRMIVASFLVKDLRIDWQSGEQYFMAHLLDADVAANNGNWQWCASTGTDAMKGFRIFNPTLQGKKFDPDGLYIRRYVPELASVPTANIHEPHLLSRSEQDAARCRIGIDYPA